MQRLGMSVAVLVWLVTGMTVVSGAPALADDGDTAQRYSRMMLVLDSSGSMQEPAAGGQTKIAAAKTALGKVVDALPDGADVGLRVFGAEVFSRGEEGACTDSQLVVPPSADNREDLRRAISDYRPYGETPIGYALTEAGKDIGGEGERSIVLVSDGVATCEPDPCVVAAKLAKKGISLRIDVVGLGVTGEAQRQLQCIADKGNGTYYGVDSADEIVESLTRVATRAVRPFTFEGLPIIGSNDPTLPTPITQGVWTDTLPHYEQQRYYSYERTIPGSTLRVSAITSGAKDKWDAISVELKDAAGLTCGRGNEIRTADRTAIISAQAMSHDGTSAATNACATDSTMNIQIGRSSAWDAEATPMQILVVEEPPVTDPTALPAGFDGEAPAQRPTSGASREVVGGNSFPDAPLVTAGKYRGSTVPGEASMFKVHLDWGQSLAVRYDFPKGTPQLQKRTGVQGPFGTIRVFDPMRASIDDRVADAVSEAFATGDSPSFISAGTVPVRYNNRSTIVDGSSLAGDYFIQLSVAPDSDRETYELPYTMSVQVLGQPQGVPTYTDQADWTVLDGLSANSSDDADTSTPGTEGATEPATETATGATAEATDEAAQSEDATRVSSEPGGSGPSRLLVGGGLGALALLCLGGALALFRRGRMG